MIGCRNFDDSIRGAALSIAGVAAGIVWALCLPYNAGAQGGFDGPGWYEIANLKSGKVLDMDRNDQTSVIQYSSQGTDNQVWEIQPSGEPGLYYLRNAMNGSVLEADGTRNSTPVRTARFDGGANQQWRFDTGKDGNALIVSRLGKALDIPGGTSADGARVQIYDIDGDSNQRFIFRKVSGGRRYGRSGEGFGGDRRSDNAAITCASDDGRRVYCDADTRRGVRLVRQISGSPCQEGSTWGYDARGIWVDRGCRAEFVVSGEGFGGYGRPDSAAITCASDDGRRVYCDADTRRGVRLVRQMSGSACQEGSTWGYDARGIWVDRGCRAEFVSGEGTGQPEQAWGTIAADPNPCRIERGRSECTSYITWSTRGVTQARVYVTNDSQRGTQQKEFGSSTACESSRCSAPWIARGKAYQFTLVDFSSGRRGQVLASVTVTATDARRR